MVESTRQKGRPVSTVSRTDSHEHFTPLNSGTQLRSFKPLGRLFLSSTLSHKPESLKGLSLWHEVSYAFSSPQAHVGQTQCVCSRDCATLEVECGASVWEVSSGFSSAGLDSMRRSVRPLKLRSGQLCLGPGSGHHGFFAQCLYSFNTTVQSRSMSSNRLHLRKTHKEKIAIQLLPFKSGLLKRF